MIRPGSPERVNALVRRDEVNAVPSPGPAGTVPEGKQAPARSRLTMRTFFHSFVGLLFFTLTVTAQTTEPAMVGELPGQFDLPAGKPKAVVVLLHGSGSHTRDEDLSAVTEGGKSNLFFQELSRAFVAEGIAVLRYDKRNHVLTSADPQDKEAIERLTRHPGQAFIADAMTAVEQAHQRFPSLPVALVGHSEGTWVALQAAKQDQKVSAVGMIGYCGASLETLVQEQVAHRYVEYFRGFDKNGDGQLDRLELPANLAQQLPVLDLDGDGTLSYDEFQAGNLSNVLLKPIISDGWRLDEASLPTASRLVQEADIPLVFFQGEWDNQTPAYYVKAVEIAERQVWKKGNKSFHYFERAGHALDPRRFWDDVVYSVTPEESFARVAKTMAETLSR